MANHKVKVVVEFRDQNSDLMDVFLVKGGERFWLMGHRKSIDLFNLLRTPMSLGELYSYNDHNVGGKGRRRSDRINHSIAHICKAADEAIKYGECFC